MGYGEFGAVVKTPTSDTNSSKEHLIEQSAAQSVAKAERSEMLRLFSSLTESAKTRLGSRLALTRTAR